MENNNALQVFSYNGRQLRTVLIDDDDVWFVAKDVMDEIKSIAQALSVPEVDLLNDNCTQSTGWVLSIRIAHNLEQEVIDLSKGVPRIASITTTKDGGLLTLGGSYENWTDDSSFKKLIADLKKFRSTVIQNGIALGGIKD